MAVSDQATVLRCYPKIGPIQTVHACGMAGGWSGSAIWRIAAVDRDYCLRRWPSGQTPDRLRLIYQVLTHAAARGIDYVPVPLTTGDGNSHVWHQGNFWELTPWMPGVADFRSNPSAVRLSASMEALARFHLAISGVASGGLVSGTHQPPDGPAAPAVSERLETVTNLLRGDFDRIAGCSRSLNAELDQRSATILSLARHRLQPLVAPLIEATRLHLALQPAIRDVHHDHLLFTGDRVTGLIDFGAMRIDTPLVDVARLVGSLAGDDPPRRIQSLHAYSNLHPLTDQDRRVIDLLDECNVVLSGLSWLRWLYVDRRDMGPIEPIVARLDEIIARLTGAGLRGRTDL
jgi:Ser/Thr protein kinase RdoA (MazF antagonist)